MELRRQLGIARKWLPLLLAFAVIGAGAAFALSSVQAKVYEARATLIVGQSLEALNPDFNQLMVSQRLSTTYAAIATMEPALSRVIDKLDLDTTPAELERRVWAEAGSDSTLLTLNAQDTDPARAAAIANALADDLIAASPAIQGRQSEFQQSIDDDLAATQDQIATTQRRVDQLAALRSPEPADIATLETLQGRLVSLRATYASLLSYSTGNANNLLSIVAPALAPDGPVLPRVALNTMLGGLVGLLIAFALAAILEYLDDRVKNTDIVQETVGLSTLGTVARMPTEAGRAEFYQLATLLNPRSVEAEAYRTLRSNVEFGSVDTPLRTLLVTSAAPSDGKTITASNLAVAFAQTGRSTILVDADLRKPGVHHVFQASIEHGLTTLLRRDDVSVDAVAQGTEEPNLRVITTGPLPPNPAEMLGSHRMSAVVEQLKAAADLVIFDAPPVRAVADALVMSSYLDATLLVVNAERTRRDALRHAREALARAGANVLGVVLNRVPKSSTSAYYGYGYFDNPRDDAADRPSATTPGLASAGMARPMTPAAPVPAVPMPAAPVPATEPVAEGTATAARYRQPRVGEASARRSAPKQP